MSTCPINAYKPRVAIFDLTDCEGCEVETLSLSERIVPFTSKVEIVNWRLFYNEKNPGPYDITLIEGSVVTKEDEDLVKLIREKSTTVIAIGACACIGGIPAMIKEKDRGKLTKYVYGKDYKPLAKDAKPINKFIKVDYYLNGCPINSHQLENIISKLLSGQKIISDGHPVCYDCKIKGNSCLLLSGKSCLGPITQGGCGAICPSNGVKCYGCWGPIEQANYKAIITALKNQGRSKPEITQIIDMFMEENKEINKLLK